MHFLRSMITTATRRGLVAAAALGLAALLAGCATPVATQVTTFQRWPADARGQTFAFSPQRKLPLGELEQRRYEGLVADELLRWGLQASTPGAPLRFLVEVRPAVTPQQRQFAQPVYVDEPYWVPGHFTRRGYYVPPRYAYDPWGPRYVGQQVVVRAVQEHRLDVVIRDNLARPPGGQPPAVFEGSAVLDSGAANLAVAMPYLVRSVFEGFPGANGQTRVVRIDPETMPAAAPAAPTPAAPASAPKR